jgi:hypothetical protein
VVLAEKKARPSFGTYGNPIHVAKNDASEQTAPNQETPPQRASASPNDSALHSPQEKELDDPNGLQEVLMRELFDVEAEMMRVQEEAFAAKRKAEELEKALTDELCRLTRIRGQLAALKKDEEGVQREANKLGSERQAATAEERLRWEQWEGLQESKCRLAAELEAAHQAERAQQELDAAQRELAAKRQVLEEKKRAVSAAWLRERRLQRERERKATERQAAEQQAKWEQEMHAAEQAERERLEREQTEWNAKCDREAAEAKKEQEQEAAAEKERRRREEKDQAEMSDDNCSPRQKHVRIGILKFQLEVLIRKVGSPEARGLLLKNELKRAYFQAAKENHSDKGNRDEGAIKELNSLKSDIERFGGW